MSELSNVVHVGNPKKHVAVQFLGEEPKVYIAEKLHEFFSSTYVNEDAFHTQDTNWIVAVDGEKAEYGYVFEVIEHRFIETGKNTDSVILKLVVDQRGELSVNDIFRERQEVQANTFLIQLSA